MLSIQVVHRVDRAKHTRSPYFCACRYDLSYRLKRKIVVTNNPDLTINPDDDDDDLELYGAPVQPPVKPRFIDAARLANAWCQHYPETAQRGNNAEPQNVVEAKDDGHQHLAYPSPPPQYEHFDPVLYPVPWDNNPVPVHLRDELP
jgi:hypothetical protein